VADGKVFDLVEPVVARYGQGPKKSRIEVWKRRRPISSIEAGKTLRILAADGFDVVYTLDGWASQQRIKAAHFGASGAAADITIPPKGAQELVFTLFWSGPQQWEGRNFSVKIDTAPPAGK
jgi:glucoamylase